MIHDYETLCGSVFVQVRDGKPWNHLCVKPVGHTSRHTCWHGQSCGSWVDDEERKPRQGMQLPSRKKKEKK